jgi:hypothetical protein
MLGVCLHYPIPVHGMAVKHRGKFTCCTLPYTFNIEMYSASLRADNRAQGHVKNYYTLHYDDYFLNKPRKL